MVREIKRERAKGYKHRITHEIPTLLASFCNVA